MLAASGIGAILSPPTLGAAAFIIAEFLGVSYLTVLLYALIPSLLYYLGILLAIEADARRFDTDEVVVETPPVGRLLLRYGYHFSSLFAIVLLLALGLSPFRSVLYATVLAFLLSFLDPKYRMGAGAGRSRRSRRARGRCCRWRRRARRPGSSSRSSRSPGSASTCRGSSSTSPAAASSCARCWPRSRCCCSASRCRSPPRSSSPR